MAAKVLGKLAGGVRGNRSEAQGFAGVDAIFQEAEQTVIKRAMKAAESHSGLILLQLSQAMKDRMHENEIGVGGIDAGREDGVKAQMAKPAVAHAVEPVSKHPEEKGEEMRSGQTRNAMPEDVLVGIFGKYFKGSDRQIRDLLGIEMNLVAVALRKSCYDFGEGTLGAMAPVYKRREDSDAQVRSSLQRRLTQRRESLPGRC